MRGRKPCSHASPWAIGQSCMELQAFGTISEKSAAFGSNPVRSVMFAQRAASRWIERKLIAGLCLRT